MIGVVEFNPSPKLNATMVHYFKEAVTKARSPKRAVGEKDKLAVRHIVAHESSAGHWVVVSTIRVKRVRGVVLPSMHGEAVVVSSEAPVGVQVGGISGDKVGVVWQRTDACKYLNHPRN